MNSISSQGLRVLICGKHALTDFVEFVMIYMVIFIQSFINHNQA